MPKYTEFVPNYPNKKGISYAGWTRPTINWSLDCEANGYTRADGLKTVTDNQIDFTQFAFGKEFRKRGIWNLCLTLCVPYAGLILIKGAGIFISLPLALVATFPIGLMNILLFKSVQDYTKEQSEKLNNFAQFNECVDEYTQVNIDQVKVEMDEFMDNYRAI